MLWDTNTLQVLLVVSSVVVYAVVLLSSTVSSTTMIIYDSGSYDAGIPSTNTSTSGNDKEAQGLVLYLLLHEILVV